MLSFLPEHTKDKWQKDPERKKQARQQACGCVTEKNAHSASMGPGQECADRKGENAIAPGSDIGV